MTRTRFIDLFAGIGGFHLALSGDPIGGTCVFACDIDEDCRAIYSAAFPATRLAGDIRAITEPDSLNGASSMSSSMIDEHIATVIPAHDVLCAGFPCQPFSKSGHQRGIDETRGTLFFDILRVLQVRRPRFVLLENVMNLVGPRHRETWKTIVAQLRSLGYATSDTPTILSPHSLPLSEGGRPQHRERVFIPAVYVGDRAESMTSLGPLVDRHPFGAAPNWKIDEFLDETDQDQLEVRPEQATAIEIWDDFVKSIDGRLPGIPLWADYWRDDYEPDPVAPEWKTRIIRSNVEFYSAHQGAIDAWFARHAEFTTMFASFRKLEWQARDGYRSIWSHAIQFRPSGIRVRPLTYLPALVAITQTSVIGPRRRRLSVREAARLQGFPESFPVVQSPAGYRQLGNAVSVGVTNFVARALILGTAGSQGELAPLEWREAAEPSPIS